MEPLHGVHRPRVRPLQRCRPSRAGVPALPGSPRDLWPRWISEGWFEWEPDGWPFWSHHHHLSTWWESRDLPNVFFVHFGDLLADPEEIRRLAAFCDIDMDEGPLGSLLAEVTIDAMRARGARRRDDDPRR